MKYGAGRDAPPKTGTSLPSLWAMLGTEALCKAPLPTNMASHRQPPSTNPLPTWRLKKKKKGYNFEDFLSRKFYLRFHFNSSSSRCQPALAAKGLRRWHLHLPGRDAFALPLSFMSLLRYPSFHKVYELGWIPLANQC